LSEERINWHLAFNGALHLELEEYRDYLDFQTECQLADPLRIDLLIIKKRQDLVITKNIGAIFRHVNVAEFKAPGDYISIDGFSKTMAYCYLYASLNRLPITDLSLTFVETGHPRDVLGHLSTVYQWEAEEREPGLYEIRGAGMAFPIQFIESRKLSETDNLWLKSLSRGLTAQRLDQVLKGIHGNGEASVLAYIHALLRANLDTLREVAAMENLTLEQVLEESGLTAKWEARGIQLGEARGEARGQQRIKQEVISLLRQGVSPEELIKRYDSEKIRNEEN
jgi:hypothetical protein